MIKNKLENWIKDTLGINTITLEHPADFKRGDFTLVSRAKNPEEEFEALQLVLDKFPEIEKVEIANGRFINIFLKKEFFADAIKEVLESGEGYGENKSVFGQKVIIEYTNTNVLKPLHIGHLMGNVIGESLSRIFESSGAEVKRNTYQGDAGLHIAKTLWGIQNLRGKIEGDLHTKIAYVGEAYALGANKYEDDTSVQEEIKEINKKLFDKGDADLLHLYTWARQVSLDHFEELYKKLGTKFDYYFFESEVVDDSLRIVKKFLGANLFEESEGAIVFHGEKYDKKLHTRVFVSSQGIPMYEAKDIAHAIRKEKTYSADRSIIITANEQDGYFNVVLCALSHIDKSIAEKTEHVSHGLLKLADGKMSSRKGNVITGESLISDVEDLVKEKIQDRELSDTEKTEIAEAVAIGAIKFSILRQAVGGDIIFDFDQSISFEGDSGPYLQYTAVRANSILEKANYTTQISGTRGTLVPEGWQTTDLERVLYRFPEVVEVAYKEYAPHKIVSYLLDIASRFNSFYSSHKIIDDSDPASLYKIALTKAVANVITNGLYLLGIKVPERM